MFIRDFQLNIGGLIGALICLAAFIAIMAILSKNGQFPNVGAWPFGLSLAAGGALGNWIWGLAFPAPPTV